MKQAFPENLYIFILLGVVFTPQWVCKNWLLFLMNSNRNVIRTKYVQSFQTASGRQDHNTGWNGALALCGTSA
jgi:hypothetical protein